MPGREPNQNLTEIASSLNVAWRGLCERYLPVRSQSIWRYSRLPLDDDPEQGWKLHLSATVLSANALLQTVGSFLHSHKVLFKAPLSLEAMYALNSGILYGYCQVGKCITVYPRTSAEAKALANKLHLLTSHLSGPAVPFDHPYRPNSCVFYRYGAFKSLSAAGVDDERRFVILSPEGTLVPDRRDSTTWPEWVDNPFAFESTDSRNDQSLLKTRFKAFRALTQRGKGGVYQALDIATLPPRLCILKEGRQHGEVDWDGRDGAKRIKHEEVVLRTLREAGVKVPCVYLGFIGEKNHYLALEFIEGENFEQLLRRRQRRLALASALQRSIEISKLVGSIHAAGWVWRDCKPRNLILSKSGDLRPLDFEGACRIDAPDPLPWGTSSYISPEATGKFDGQSRLPEDLYALGVVIYLLLSGRTPDYTGFQALHKLRSNLPPTVANMVMDLLASNPTRRPQAATVTTTLEVALRKLSRAKSQCKSPIRRARSLNRASRRKSS